MGYPYTFADFPTPNNTSYADVQAVQLLVMSYRISTDKDLGTPRQIHEMLIWCSREIDSVLLRQGVQVPPPDTAAIMPLLTQTCALGASAMLAHSRYETGDEIMGTHATQLMTAYDASMGLLERGDINLVQMGMISAGWAETVDRRTYFRSGNLEPLSDGTMKTPFITMQTQW